MKVFFKTFKLLCIPLALTITALVPRLSQAEVRNIDFLEIRTLHLSSFQENIVAIHGRIAGAPAGPTTGGGYMVNFRVTPQNKDAVLACFDLAKTATTLQAAGKRFTLRIQADGRLLPPGNPQSQGPRPIFSAFDVQYCTLTRAD